MGRKSKLTAEQWLIVERRMVEGESIRALAREYGVAESSIRQRKTTQVAEIRNAATALVAAERTIASLPISAQISAHTLAARLRAISDSLAGAAQMGAATAHRLSAIANSQVAKVDDADPSKSMDMLRDVAVLTKMANEASTIGLNLLSANKEIVKNADLQLEDDPMGAVDMRDVEDAMRRIRQTANG